MKRVIIWFATLALVAPATWAQESATQQQIDKLSGQIQDIEEGMARQSQRMDALERELGELKDKVNAPVVNDYANRSDLKALADQVQELDRKRQEDRDLIVKQIENLTKAVAATPVATPVVHPTRPSKPDSDDTSTAPPVPSKGYEYEVKQGDTLGLIAKAYRDQGVKVTKAQIIAANPKMNPNILIPGKKIFIPDPNAK
jgi:LysM repeat protein